jgi:hypothetical protein
MFIGQVSANEIKHVNFAYPKTEAECESFSFASYRATVKALPQDKFPVFHQKHVRAFTATMLITQDTVRALADDGNPKDGSTDKYCRTCKCKHAKGKHTKEGEKRYAAKQADRKAAKVNEKGKADEVLRAEKGGNATKSDDKVKGEMPRRTPGRCFKCGERHYPFCKRGPGDRGRGPCHVCKKVHFPYCKRPKAENRSMDAIPDKESLKVHITEAIAQRINELFMMVATVAGLPSNICRAVVTVVTNRGKTADIVVSPDSVSSVSVAKAEYLHDIHDENSGPITGFQSTGSLNKAGTLIIPHKTKPGATFMKAFVDKGNLPSGVEIL